MPTSPLLPNERIGVIAGRGDLPAMIVQAAQDRALDLFVLAFRGDTPPSVVESVPHEWLDIAEIARTLEIFREQEVRQIVMAGKLSRPPLKALRPPALASRIVARLGKALFSGDDSLFKAVVNIFEEEGFRVVGVDDIVGDLITPEGLLTKHLPDSQARQDIDKGIRILKEIGHLDIGQGVLIQQGLVLGVEAMEGTDALIERCRDLGPAQGGVLIKGRKPLQEQRIDLPAIGPETVQRMADAGFSGIAAEAGGSLLIRRQETLALANRRGIFILGFHHDAIR